ncbi:MAG TPA: SRPBCC domain-containing protein [Thermoanaerobaculia bacterium]|nr:SRPBCC domain-containing protein [Thermoanaerobaculia bacterium]
MALPIREGDIPGIQLRVRRSLRIDRSEAWRWLVEPRRVESWLADRAEIDPGPRGGLRLQREAVGGDPDPARGAAAVGGSVETGRTERYDPGRSWVLAFRKEDPHWETSTRLELTLFDADGGCEIDVFQTGFQHLALSACLTIWEEYRRRWRDALARLGELTG